MTDPDRRDRSELTPQELEEIRIRWQRGWVNAQLTGKLEILPPDETPAAAPEPWRLRDLAALSVLLIVGALMLWSTLQNGATP